MAHPNSPNRPTSVVSTNTAIRMGEALRYRESGLKYRQIAEKMECSIATAHELVVRGLEQLNDQAMETAAQIRTIELNRLDEMWMELERKKDQSPKVLETKIKVMERRARLLGLDAPVQIGGPDGGPIPISITDARETLRARVAQVTARIAAGQPPAQAVAEVVREAQAAAAEQPAPAEEATVVTGEHEVIAPEEIVDGPGWRVGETPNAE